MTGSDLRADNSFAADTLRELVRNSDDCFFVMDKELRYRCVSETVVRLAGLEDAENLIGKTDYDLYPRELADKYRASDKSVLESGRPILGRTETLPDLNGGHRRVKTWKYAIHDASGNIVGVYGLCRDISETVMLEQQAKAAENYIRLIDNIPGGVGILHEKDGVIHLDFANDGCFEVQHNTRESWKEHMGPGIMDAIYPPDRQAVEDEYLRIKDMPGETGSADYRVAGLDGQLHWVNMRFRAAYEKDGLQYYYAAYSDLDKQKLAEKKLEESRNALEEAIENSGIQFFTYFPGQARCEIYAASQRLAELPAVWTRFPDDFLEYMQASEADSAQVRAMVSAIDKGAEQAECLVRLAYKNVFSWEKMRLKAVRGDDGGVIRAQGYSINVTSRKNAEERIRKERVKLKSLEGGIFEAFTFNLTKGTDPDIQTADSGMTESVTDSSILAEALELCPSLAVSSPATMNILLRAAARIPDAGERKRFILACTANAVQGAARDGKHSSQLRYRRYVGGELRWVSTSTEVLPDPESGDLIAFYYTRDINDEVILEEITAKLIGLNYRTVSFIDLQTNRLFVIAASDPRDREHDSRPYDEAIGEAIRRSVIPEEQDAILEKFSLDTVQRQLEGASVYSFFHTVTERSGKFPGHPQRRMKNDVFYLNENRDVIVLLMSDVTEIFEQERDSRSRLESALIAAEQASIAKTEFLSRMSHEIRTPMNAIIGLDAIALQEKGLSPGMVDHLQKIGISARFLLSLINDILDMSRIESGRLALRNEPFNFEELIGGINTILYEQCRSSGLDYECVLKSSTEESYTGDATKLQQVLINLLGNAVKFTPCGGKIHFMIEQIARTKDTARLRFEISDTGIGIDDKFIPHLFEPFAQENRGRTSAYGGTGLGLAISRNIVSLMNGDITVHSIKNIGSEFTIEVELGLTRESINRRELERLVRPLSTLVVDDDIIVCRHTQLILNEAGLKTDYVDSGAAAIERVTERHKARRDYDLILLDWQMPDMDGISTAREIRRIVGPEVTIIIMTAYDWADIEKKAMAAGVDLFMKKPIFASSVTRAFENVFLRKREPVRESESDFDFSGRRVLLAEDNAINAEIARNLLELKGCDVELTSNGAEAVEAFAAAPTDRFDAVLMEQTRRLSNPLRLSLRRPR